MVYEKNGKITATAQTDVNKYGERAGSDNVE